MPIKGLTDQPRAFVELGQLRKGAPKPTNQMRPGADLTYFRATFHEGEEEAAKAFYEEYGNEPRAIEVFLPFDEPGPNFETWKEAYLASGLIHRCDGEYVQYAVDHESGEVLVQNGKDADGNPVECNGEPVAWYTNKHGKEQPVHCKPEGRLKVIVPALHRLAYMMVLTHSIWDIVNLSSQLEGYWWENNQKLRGIRFVLKRRPKMISTPSGIGGKRARRKKWLLHIEPAPSWVEEQLAMLEESARPKLLSVEGPLELPPEVPDTNDHAEIVEAESESPTDPAYTPSSLSPSPLDARAVVESITFTTAPERVDYPATMVELKSWAEGDPYHFTNGEIRAAIEKRLADELGDDHPTPEAFKKEVGEAEAIACFWDAILMEYQLRQAPAQEELPF